MAKSPAFQLYADDFLAGTADMTQEEVGAYILLLCHQWNKGVITLDIGRLSLIAKGKVSEHVLSKFPDGKNSRLETIRIERETFLQRQSEAGKKAMAKRWAKKDDNQCYNEPITSLLPKDKSPSPSPSPIKGSINAGASGEAGEETPQPPKAEPNPQVTPPKLEAVKAVAVASGASPECAEAFWNTYMAVGWVDGQGRAIRSWQFAFRKYAATWRANDFQRSKTQKTTREQEYERTGIESTAGQKIRVFGTQKGS